MATMTAIAEVDEAGRIVLPQDVRDALHLVAGSKLKIECEGESFRAEPARKPRGLYYVKGFPVFDGGDDPPFDVQKAIEEDRDGRMERLLP